MKKSKELRTGEREEEKEQRVEERRKSRGERAEEKEQRADERRKSRGERAKSREEKVIGVGEEKE